MPGKAMAYKFLNTFIDDLFAFTVKMPWLHRLATLRDDVIFFIWLYQSWKYKIDFKRVNEFGQGGDSDEEVETVTSTAAAKAIKEEAKEEVEEEVKEQLATQSSSQTKSKQSTRKRK